MKTDCEIYSARRRNRRSGRRRHRIGDHRLIGATVTNLDNTPLGTVTGVAGGAADDIYTITVELNSGATSVHYPDELKIARSGGFQCADHR